MKLTHMLMTTLLLSTSVFAVGDNGPGNNDQFVSVCDRSPFIQEAIITHIYYRLTFDGDKRIPSMAAQNLPMVKCHEISRSQLENIGRKKGDSSDSSIYSVDLNFNDGVISTDKPLQKHDLANLINIEEVNITALYNSELTTIDGSLFKDMKQLKHINISGNTNLINLPKVIANNIQSVTLWGDFKDHEPDSSWSNYQWIESLPNLTKLHILYAGLADIPEKAFKNNKKLNDLNLQGNRFGSTPIAAKNIGGQLTRFNLYDNPLVNIKKDDYSSFSKVTDLDIDSYYLQKIEAGAFQGLDSLKSLSITSKETIFVEDGALDTLANLESLTIKANVKVQKSSFSGAHNLINLYLELDDVSTLRTSFKSHQKLVFVKLDCYSCSKKSIKQLQFSKKVMNPESLRGMSDEQLIEMESSIGNGTAKEVYLFSNQNIW